MVSSSRFYVSHLFNQDNKNYMWSLQSFSNEADIFSLSPNSLGCKSHFRIVFSITHCQVDSQTSPLISLLMKIRPLGLKVLGYDHENLCCISTWEATVRHGQPSQLEFLHSYIHPFNLRCNKFQRSIPFSENQLKLKSVVRLHPTPLWNLPWRAAWILKPQSNGFVMPLFLWNPRIDGK